MPRRKASTVVGKRKQELHEVYADYQSELAYLFGDWGTPFVSGAGMRKDPYGIIVGEAPGAEEAKTKAPFVGRSGQFLFETLNREAGLDRCDVWTTNVVKYRPEGNRTPTEEEITAAAPYLGRELKAVGHNSPPVLLVGGVAIKLLGLEGGVGRWQGQYMGKYKKTGWVFYITWHPAYVLRRGKDSDAAEEFRKVLRMFGEAGSAV
jgi:uracil-DNA glycosylase